MSLSQMLIGTIRRAIPGGIGQYQLECEDGRFVPFVLDDCSDRATQIDLDELEGEFCELVGRMRLHVFIVETIEVLP